MAAGSFKLFNNSENTITVTTFSFTIDNTKILQHADLSVFGEGSDITTTPITLSSPLVLPPRTASSTFTTFHTSATLVSGDYLSVLTVTGLYPDTSSTTTSETTTVRISGTAQPDPEVPYSPTFDGGGGGNSASCSDSNSTSCSAGGGGGGGGGDCFTALTPVTMADGTTRPIKEVAVGNQVLNYNGTAINTVRFIERVPDSIWESLYTPNRNYLPFATVNHPLYINEVWSSVDPEETAARYPWLSKTQKVIPYELESARGETVYNLWVDGDGTYQVHGYGTTSLIGDGGWVRLSVEQGYLTYEQAMFLLLYFSSLGLDIQYGSYLINKFLGWINLKFINRTVARALTAETTSAKLITKIAGLVGRLAHITKGKYV
jgi:hypothetical protein